MARVLLLLFALPPLPCGGSSSPFAQLLVAINTSAAQTRVFRHDFESDAEGWDAAPAAGRGGVGPLPAAPTGRGTLLLQLPPLAPLFDPANATADPAASSPFIDGPTFLAPFSDATFAVVRMRHLGGGGGGGGSGGSAWGAFAFRNGSAAADAAAGAHAGAHVWPRAPASWWRAFPVAADGRLQL